jgi:hypothetical protein
MHKNKKELFLFYLYVLVASLLVYLLKAELYLTILFYFIVPSIYLSFRLKVNKLKIFLFSLYFGIPFGAFIDFFMTKTNGWEVVRTFVPNYKIFGYATIVNIIWFIAYVYFVLIFYEYFFEKHKKEKVFNNWSKYFITFTTILFISIPFIYYYLNYLTLNYFYLIIGLFISIIPTLFFIIKLHSCLLVKKAFLTSIFFTFLSLAYEIIALKLNIWRFVDAKQFVGYINVLSVSFPFEELFFWIILGPFCGILMYDVFDENIKIQNLNK